MRFFSEALLHHPRSAGTRDGAASTRPDAVCLVSNPDSIKAEWDALFARSNASAYQSFDFYSACLDTLEQGVGASPFIIAFRAPCGRLRGLLPLVRRRRAGVTALEFCGGAHSNFNMPIGDDDPANPILSLGPFDWRDIVRTLDAGIDLLNFSNIPAIWSGARIALAGNGAHDAPDIACAMDIHPGNDAIRANVSAKRVKQYRRNIRRLAEIGEARFVQNTTPELNALILQAFLEQKSKQFSVRGHFNPFADKRCVDFLNRLSATADARDTRRLLFHALQLDGEVVATLGMLKQGATGAIMVMSMTANPFLARLSPGETLLMNVIEWCGQQRLNFLDFGVGGDAYKERVCQHMIPMRECHIGLTYRGELHARAARIASAGKRMIKQNPALLEPARRMQALLAG